ncbi:MAG: NADH dehydrogenase (quinone) subunit D [Bdellovibrionaceae bacterium]|nr:NADH dehydrogenase (quinone) subunit D [Pseudobdellovibrionaceae bacterium]
MTKIDELKQELDKHFKTQNFKFSNVNGDDVLEIPKEEVSGVLKHLKASQKFDFLMDVCGVDYPTREKRFDVVYHLFSSKDASRLRIKVQLAEGESVQTATKIWKGADWFEREAYDMFGIHFEGHANLRKILTHHQFQGHPLRKDYEADHQQHCTETLPVHFDNEGDVRGDILNEKLVPINIGPSHPAMHGTLRVMAELDGETVVRANCEIGYLHRCFEKMAETHPYNQVIPYTDRLNYCSAPMNNVGYCKAVERLLGVEIPAKAQAMRVILCELSRVIDHIVAVGTGGVDLGALTAFFHLFTYREKVYTLFEKLCGARLTVSLTRVGGMAQDAPESWFDDVMAFCKEMREGVDEISRLMLDNKIFIKRTQGVSPVSATEAINWGYTGPLLRASGVNLDLRKAKPYYGYDGLNFDVPVGTNGDIYDRYLVRIEEMRQSLRIIEQVCKNVPGGDYTIRDKGIVLPEKKDVYGNIEGLMNHFMLVIKGLRPPVGEVYDATEAANGELGFYLISDGSANPYRLKVRPPCFAIYQSFPHVVKGTMLADAIATVASMNVIAGELDR